MSDPRLAVTWFTLCCSYFISKPHHYYYTAPIAREELVMKQEEKVSTKVLLPNLKFESPLENSPH
jgi:hypothetical protein